MSILLLLDLVICPVFGTGQISGPSDRVEISVQETTATPGERVGVPVSISFPDRAPTEFSFQVTFPTELASFAEARGAVQQPELTLETQIEETEQEATLLVRGTSEAPLSSGELVRIVLEISNQVYTDTEMTLRFTDTRLTGPEGDLVSDSEATEGTINISISALVFGCFFYMH